MARLALAVAALGTMTVPAGARVSVTDPSDAGPLDILKVRAKQANEYEVSVEITLSQAISPADLRPPNLLVVDVDHSGDGRGDHWFYIAPWRGRLVVHTREVPDDYTTCCNTSVRRISPRTLRFRYPLFTNYGWYDGGHLFRVASYYEGPACPRGCFDATPNRRWAINDFTPPTIASFKVPIAGHAEAKPGAVLTYQIFDKGFSGIGKHDILKRSPGETLWTTLARRSGSGRLAYRLDLDQGETAQLRLRVRDRSGHSTTSEMRAVTAPFDESQLGATTYFGLWESQTATEAYMGTLRVSQTALDTFSFTGSGTHYCVLHAAGPEFGTGTMSVDGVSVPLDMRAAVPMHRQKTCVNLPTSRERTVEVYPASGVINIDGFWVDSVADPYAANEYNPTAAQG